jgi:hypothetical protein
MTKQHRKGYSALQNEGYLVTTNKRGREHCSEEWRVLRISSDLIMKSDDSRVLFRKT